MLLPEKTSNAPRRQSKPFQLNVLYFNPFQLSWICLSAAKAASDADKTIAHLTTERDALQKKLADMMKTSSDSNEVAIGEINSLRKRMADREEEFKQDKMNTQRAHDQALKDLRDRHQAELSALSSGKQSMADDLAAKEKQYLAELSAQKQSYEAKIDALLKAHQKQLEELNGQQSEQAERLKGSISGLESQLQAVTEQAESDKAGLRNEATKLDAKAKALQVSKDRTGLYYRASSDIIVMSI